MPGQDHTHDEAFAWPDDLPEDIGPSLIELQKIPRHAWTQVLTPLHPQLRFHVARQVPDERLREAAYKLVAELNTADRERRHARERARGRGRTTAAPLPAPDAVHAVTRPTVQVNLRLRRDDYALLVEAANAVAMKPTTLARALVLNGSRKVLQERGAT